MQNKSPIIINNHIKGDWVITGSSIPLFYYNLRKNEIFFELLTFVFYIVIVNKKTKTANIKSSKGEMTNELNGMFKSWAEKPVFITPNLKRFETY